MVVITRRINLEKRVLDTALSLAFASPISLVLVVCGGDDPIIVSEKAIKAQGEMHLLQAVSDSERRGITLNLSS